jgi:hypothetical protein
MRPLPSISLSHLLSPLLSPPIPPRVLQQLLSLKDDKNGGGTISVIWNMRDNVKYVQNRMAWILDLVESLKNIFTWVVPSKVISRPILVFSFRLLSSP